MPTRKLDTSIYAGMPRFGDVRRLPELSALGGRRWLDQVPEAMKAARISSGGGPGSGGPRSYRMVVPGRRDGRRSDVSEVNAGIDAGRDEGMAKSMSSALSLAWTPGLLGELVQAAGGCVPVQSGCRGG